MASFMTFRISGDNLAFDALIEAFGAGKVHICKKGNTFYDRITKTADTFREDCFTVSREYDDSIPPDEAIFSFVSSFLPHKKGIRDLAKENMLMFWLSLYPEEYQTNICLSPKTLARLSEIGIELNIEISFLREFYQGTSSGTPPVSLNDSPNCITFQATGDNLDFDGLIETFRMEGIVIRKKGDAFYDESAKKTDIYIESRFAITDSFHRDIPVDGVAGSFVAKFLPYKKYIRSLAVDKKLAFCLALYLSSIHTNIRFSPKTLMKFKNIGIVFNMQISFLTSPSDEDDQKFIKGDRRYG